MRRQMEAPAELAGVTARRVAARKRAVEEKERRLEQALAQLPEMKQQREAAAQRAGAGRCGQKIREKPLRVSTSDAEARVMKMANGGFNAAVNVQLATDTRSRAIVGVEVSNAGYDAANLSEPMRRQVEQRSGGKVGQHLLDGGYLRKEDIERAQERGVELFVPPKPARKAENRGRELEIKPGDSVAIQAWKQRMASETGQEIYKQRAATSETVNGDLRCYRGLTQMTVRGLSKMRCVALWCALAYNLLHFGGALLQSC